MVELVMVLAVISLMAGLAIPRYSSAAVRFRLKSAAHRVGADVMLARQTARAGSTAVTMSFVTGGNGYYEIGGVKNMDTAAAVYRVNMGEDPYRVVLKVADFGGATDLVFDGFGVGMDGEVELTAAGMSCSVQVEGVSGAVRYFGP